MPERPLPRDLWGRDLRTAVLAHMLFWPRVWTLRQLRLVLLDDGFSDPGGKTLADALGHEVSKGRVRRVARGAYQLDRIPERTRTRIKARLRSTPRYPPSGS